MKQFKIGTEVVISPIYFTTTQPVRTNTFKNVITDIQRSHTDTYDVYMINEQPYCDGELGVYCKVDDTEFGVFQPYFTICTITDDKSSGIIEAYIYSNKGYGKFISELVRIDENEKLYIDRPEHNLANYEHYEDLSYIFKQSRKFIPIKGIIQKMIDIYNENI